MANGIDRLTRVLAKRQTAGTTYSNDRNAVRGEISGKRVLVGGRSYRYDPAVDMPLADGDKVRVFMDGQTAVVIGK